LKNKNDPYGERIKIKRFDSANTTVYTPFKELMRVVNSSGTFDFVYVYDGNNLVSRKNPDGTKWFYHNDHLGSSTLVTDEAGNAIANYSYAPYGEVVLSSSDEVKLYTGQFNDELTEQYYYGARYYIPAIGKFGQADPITPNPYKPQTLNHYAYVSNNPYRYTDPDGQYQRDVHYDLTEYLATNAGFSANDAKVIAFGNQFTDENPETSPINPYNLGGATKQYHFQSTESADQRVIEASKSNDLLAFGQSLHPLDDSYSHRDFIEAGQHAFRLRWWGLEFVGDKPDLTYNDPVKADNMAYHKFMRLAMYNDWNINQINEKWNQIEPTVNAFNRATSYDRKKQILAGESIKVESGNGATVYIWGKTGVGYGDAYCKKGCS